MTQDPPSNLFRGHLRATPKQAELIAVTRAEPNLAHLPVGYEGAKARFVVALAVVGTVMGAARSAGISPRTAQLWCAKDPKYKLRCQEAKELALMRLEEAAFDVALGTQKIAPNPQMLQFLLKTRLPEVYGDRREVVHSGQVTGVVQPAMLEAAGSATQLNEVMAALRAAGVGDTDIIEGIFVDEDEPAKEDIE